MGDHEAQVGLDDRGEPVDGLAAGAERGQAVKHVLLQLRLPLVEQRRGEAGLVAEAPVERALADARGPRDVVHAHRRDATGREQLLGRGEDFSPVARGVRTLRGGRAAQQVSFHELDCSPFSS